MLIYSKIPFSWSSSCRAPVTGAAPFLKRDALCRSQQICSIDLSLFHMTKRMKPLLLKYVNKVWNSIVNVGIQPAMPYVESRRTKLLNLLALPSIPFMFFYTVVNFVQGRYMLAGLNLASTLSALMVFAMHRRRMYLGARLVLIGVNLLIYTFTGLYFHNGAQYFLLNILIIVILVNDNRRVVIGLSLFIIIAHLLILFFPQPPVFGLPVPEERIWSNVATALLFVVLALLFFKSIQSDYEREIEGQRQALTIMNRDKERLFSIVAHDIRSPVATLDGLLEQFRNGLLSKEEMGAATAVLHDRVSRLSNTLDNLLRWSARGMQGIQMTPTHFLLAPLLAELELFFEPVVQQKKIPVSISVPSGVALYADRDQISVVFRNLFSNAIKFSFPGGQIEIAAAVQEGQVVITITDYGIGMDAELLERMFSGPQDPAYGTIGERGAGVGLLLCSEFVRQNKGTINVESAPGKGSRFSIGLPKGVAAPHGAISTGAET
ncbi:sensor histidine kinase [Niabella drilacis]|uniref:histidine kinase n=1 Tax=Niabella drilacis (strain DSM 25811 / CCM 8410 / CCUG 62505 / LMG 26954 / E90) TaxID=1285928 RepID=A0A1G7AWW4_NIADE|nr:HAMP domain-containing sensor histidine kinase [Niabella drilacis]SDE19067.1 Signal transduction histidine kinase [Niabella drilacis]